MQGQPISKSELQQKFRSFKDDFDKGRDTLPAMNEFLNILKDVNQDIEEKLYNQAELQKYFFEEFVGGITKREMLKVVYEIVMILCELYVKEIKRDNSDMADAMRCIFDQTSLLYQNFYQSEEALLSSDDPMLMLKLSEEDREWRLSLKQGSKIDAIKIEPEYNLKSWAKARITMVIGDGSYFQIEFENENSKLSRHLTRYSLDIARYNQMSDGDEWRCQLKEGDLIDAFDSTKVWYASTVMNTRSLEVGDKIIPQVMVGFRMYHPEGNKEDETTKQKYFGWSERFDEWLSAYNPRIQKFQSLAKSIDQPTANSSEETLEDQMDQLLYSNKLGGFQSILERINKEGEDTLSLETLFYYLDCLANCHIMINKVFLLSYIPQLNQAVRKKIMNASENQLRNIKKDRIDGIVNNLQGTLFNRIQPYRQRDIEKNFLNLDIGCKFLQQNFLERRIDGAKLIQEVCKNSNNQIYQYSSETIYNYSNKQQVVQIVGKVINKIKSNNVLFEMFSKDRTHLQLVKRCEELLKLLLTQNSLSYEELEQVWSCTKADEATKLELYKVLNELTPRMKEGDYQFFIEQLMQKNKQDIIHEEIELVHEMGKRQKSGTSKFGDLAVQFMWKLAFSRDMQEQFINVYSKINKQLVSEAGQSLTDIIKYWSNDHKLKYFEALIQNLRENYEGLLSIKMMMRILRDFAGEIQVTHPEQTSNQQQNDEQMEIEPTVQDKFISKPAFIEYLVEQYGLMENFFSNFQFYLENAEKAVESKLIADPQMEVNILSDKILFDKFIHSEQLNERLDFIKYIGSSSSVKISKDNLIFIWQEMVNKSQIQADQEMFFRWLKELCDIHSQYNCVIDINDLISFFKDYLSSNEISLRHLTNEGFNCIQSFFLLSNENSGKLRKLNQGAGNTNQAQKFTSYSNNGTSQYNSFSFNQSKSNYYEQEDIEILVLVDPQELEGVEGIWSIATENSAKAVQESAALLLIKLYTCVDYDLECQIPQFEEQFINKCITNIDQLLWIIQNRKEQPKEERVLSSKQLSQFSTTSAYSKQLPLEERKIIRYIALLRDLIKNSEKEGTFGIVPHSALFRGEYLPCLQISNSVKTGNKYQNKIEIGCYSNTTLWELRKMVGETVARIYNEDGNYFQEASVHPSTIRLFRFTGSIDLKEVDNGRTLAELKFKQSENMSSYKRNVYVQTKVPLIQADGETLTKAAKNIFSSWFHRFSIPDPEEPNIRIMTKATCTHFIRSCTDDNCQEDDNRVTKLFSMCDPDGLGKVLEEGFLEFYRQSSKDKEDVVRQNLFAHGYRYDLKKSPEDGSDENIMQIRPSKEDMPRFKIANQQDWFDVFFNLLSLGNEVSNASWTFIKYLTTSPILYKKILLLDRAEDFKWDNIFQKNSIYKMLYSLQIVESLLEEDQSQIDIFSEQGQLKRDWIERFLSQGGFQQILDQFNQALQLISQKQADQLNKYEKNFLEQMLKLIRIFMLAAFQSIDDQFTNTLDLIKNVSKTSDQSDQVQIGDSTDPNFKTPQKQQPNQNKQAKGNVRFQNVQTYPEITEELLFGGNEGDYDQKKDEIPEERQVQIVEQKHEEDQILEESKKFSELSAIMRQNGLGQFILNQIDYTSLQNEMLEVVSLILAKKDIANDDKMVVENSLGLWLACLLKDNTLIDEFYKFQRKQESSSLFGVKNAETFITQGLFTYKNPRVREEFMNTLLCISKQIKQNIGVKPLNYILEVLNRNFPREDLYYATRECKQYFELFSKLIELYYEEINEVQPESQIDMVQLFRTTIQKLQRYESKEKKTSLLEDNTLLGYIQLNEKILQFLTKFDRKRAMQVLEETNFVHDIFYENLFYHPLKTRSLTENKCKTKEARPVGFSLLQKYIEVLEPKELAEFLEEYVWDLVKNIEKPKKWKYVSQEGTKNQAYSGIVNLGCICYMNSMLQQFFMIPSFRYQLLKAVDNSPPAIKEYKGLKIDDNLLKQLQKMFGFLELTERQAYDPTEFCFAFKDFDGNPTNTAIQQDAQEFLNIFFDRLEQCLSQTSQKKLLDTIYGGNLCSQLICTNCGKIKNLLEGFMNLSLPVKDRKGLEDSLDKMVELGIINDYLCENCNQRVDIQKRSLIAETPNILIVHLQRFVFNFDTFLNDKVNSRFEFPTVLDLKEYSFKHIMSMENRPDEELMTEQTRHLMDISDDEYIYKLVGVTIHEGTAEHGHYYSFINIKRSNDENDELQPEWLQTEKQQWKVFEDDKIKPYSFNDMKVDAFGGNSSSSNIDNDMSQYYANTQTSYGKNAYMLVYEKKKKGELKEYIKVDQQMDQEMKDESQNIASVNAEGTLECVDTATSRATGDLPNSSVDDGSNANQQEAIRLLEFKKVQPYIPDWVREKVIEDNVRFVMDKHLYHETFFNMIKNILKHISNHIIYTQHQYPYEYVENFRKVKQVCMKIGRKVMFEMLAYYNYNTQLSDINNSLGSIITFCDSYLALQRGEESILLEFVNEAYLNDNCASFLHIMLNCPDKTSRYYIGKVTTSVINKIFSIYQEATDRESPIIKDLYEAAQKFLYVTIITLQSQDCQKNWSRLEHYFKMIYEIGINGPAQANYLLTKFDIVVELIDFILGNKSPRAIERGEKRPNMGAGSSQPPFESLVALICYLIRFSLTPEMKKEQHRWSKENYPPPSTLLGYDGQEDYTQEEKYPLSEEAFLYFTNQDFIDKVLKEGYECEELGKALAHFCYKNESFTKKVSKLLLKGISRNDYEKIKNYLDVVTQVALIRDDLQRTRLEWMFGFGMLFSQTQYEAPSNQPVSKLGVQILNSMNDEAYGFRSALIMDTNDDALLHLLYRYKGRMDVYTVSCLQSLVNLIAQDENVALYFSELPGPSYTLARYTDWIKPYLNQQLADAQRGSSSMASFKEEQKVESRKSSDKMLVDEEEEENVKNLIEQSEKQQRSFRAVEVESRNVIPCEPQPYVIVECLEDNLIKETEVDGILLQTYQLACNYTMSLPTGTTNLSIPKNRFKMNQSKFKQRRPEKLKSPLLEQTPFLNQPMMMDQGYNKQIQDSDAQWNMVNRKMQVSDDEVEDSEVIQQQIDQRVQGYADDPTEYMDQYRHPEESQPESYKVQVIEAENQQTTYQEQQMRQEEPQNDDSIPDELMEEEPIHWPNEVLYCQDLIYRIVVNNQRDTQIKINLMFSPNYQDQQINLVWPRGGIKAKVKPKQIKNIICVPKILPEQNVPNEEEILKLNFDFKWKESEKKISKNKVFPLRNSQDLKAITDQAIQGSVATVPFLDGYQQDQEDPQAAQKIVVEENLPEAPPGEKACPYCTCFNPIQASYCSVCANQI